MTLHISQDQKDITEMTRHHWKEIKLTDVSRHVNCLAQQNKQSAEIIDAFSNGLVNDMRLLTAHLMLN